MQPKSKREKIGCDAPIVKAAELEPAVWKAITEVVYNPDLVVQRVEEKYGSDKLADKQKQMAYLLEQVEAKRKELERWNEAYAAGYLDLTEWGEKKLAVQQELGHLDGAVAKLRAQLSRKDDLERQKAVALTELAAIRERDLSDGGELPFKARRRIVALLVDDIVVNANARVFEIHGVIRATRSYGQDFELESTGRNT